MLTGLIAVLNSDGVNEYGKLETVLEDYVPVNAESSIQEESTQEEIDKSIDDVVFRTKRPVCLIRIDKKNPDKLRLYFPNGDTDNNDTDNNDTDIEINWRKTIYIVSIFGKYAMINHPTTPEKLIEMFELVKTRIDNIDYPFEMDLSKILNFLDDGDSFEKEAAFVERFKPKQSAPKQSSPKQSAPNQSSPKQFRFGDPLAQKGTKKPPTVTFIPGASNPLKPTIGNKGLTRDQKFSNANPLQNQAKTSKNPASNSARKSAKNPAHTSISRQESSLSKTGENNSTRLIDSARNDSNLVLGMHPNLRSLFV